MSSGCRTDDSPPDIVTRSRPIFLQDSVMWAQHISQRSIKRLLIVAPSGRVFCIVRIHCWVPASSIQPFGWDGQLHLVWIWHRRSSGCFHCWARVTYGGHGPVMECQQELLCVRKHMYGGHNCWQQGRFLPSVGHQRMRIVPRRWLKAQMPLLFKVSEGPMQYSGDMPPPFHFLWSHNGVRHGPMILATPSSPTLED